MNHMTSTSQVESFFEERKGMTQAMLEAEIRDYRETAGESVRRLDTYVRETYGFGGVSSILDEWIPKSDSFTMCLARQIIAPSTEQLAFSILGEQLSKDLGCSWVVPPFATDCYGRHKYKESLIKVPGLVFDEEGTCAGIRRTELIGDKARRQELFTGNPPVLNGIRTDTGMFWEEANDAMFLPEFHAKLWNRITGKIPPSCVEAGIIHRKLLAACMNALQGKKPSFFFIEEDGRGKKIDGNGWETISAEERKTARPPAEWYYFFYLSLFVTGKRVLFASLDDDKDVHAMFQVMTDIERVTGRKPLIVPIPYKHVTPRCTLYFNEVNPTLMQGGGWAQMAGARANKNAGMFERMLELELRLSQRFD